MQNREWTVIGTLGEYTVMCNLYNRYTKYCLAYAYCQDDNTWAQGHYFQSLDQVFEWFYSMQD